jgi:hypothetical protein
MEGGICDRYGNTSKLIIITHLHGRPVAHELVIFGRAVLWAGGEVHGGGPDRDAVPPAERHPDLGELRGLTQRIEGQRRAAVVGA